ncbi:MAG: SelL-related redox protein [bacterium]|nr:SelL-related redox protein [bacterium]
MTSLDSEDQRPVWMVRVLCAAALYNMCWGAFVVFFPNLPFQWAGVVQPVYPEVLQGLGLMVGMYGIGYALAATDPLRQWPLVLVGLLGKVFGPIGFFQAALEGNLPWRAGWVVLVNDVVWWVPFGLILYRVYRNYIEEPSVRANFSEAMETVVTQNGQTLVELSENARLLVVFLRHFGCTFCRETLADVAEKRQELEAPGNRIVLVHMVTDDSEAARVLSRYGLEDLDRVSDPGRELYRAFGLKRGRLRQLFGLKVWWRGFRAGILDGHGLGFSKTDSFQMPGVFLMDEGQVVQAFRHNSAADRPNYEDLARCEAANTRMKKDLDMAAQIQKALLPKALPDVDGVSLSWMLDPTEELAGDTLNVIPLGAEHVGLYVLDVSGHGVSSALLSVTLSHWLSPERGQSGLFKQVLDGGKYEILPPSEVAAKLNRQFPQNLETGQYFTLIYGVLNTRTRLFKYVTAGHPAPFYAPHGAKPVQLYATGAPIGILPDVTYQDNEIQLQPGDRLYMYTDGLTEMMNTEEEQFGCDRVIEQIERDRKLPFEEGIASLVGTVREWGRQAEYDDDVAVLCLEM